MNSVLKYFLLLLVSLSCYSNGTTQSVTLYAVPPPHAIKWKSPHSLLLSTARNYLANRNKPYPMRPIGHILIELRKDSSSLITGIVPAHPGDLKRFVFEEKNGLGILFQVVDGRLERTERVSKELEYRSQNGKVAFITYNINDAAYEYLRAYVDSFRARGYDKLYGGDKEARIGKGCGCSAFGVSFLELINAFQPEYDEHWAINVNVPDRLIGESATNKKINLLKLLLSFSWARQNEPSSSLMLYDPYLIYKWIRKKWKKESRRSSGNYKLKKVNKARGLEIECDQCKPQTPMFKV